MENHGHTALFWRRSIDDAVTLLSAAGIVVGIALFVAMLASGPSRTLLYGIVGLAGMSLVVLAATTSRFIWLRARD